MLADLSASLLYDLGSLQALLFPANVRLVVVEHDAAIPWPRFHLRFCP